MVAPQNRPFRAEMQFMRRRPQADTASGGVSATAADTARSTISASIGEALLSAIGDMRDEIRRDVEALLDRKLSEFRAEFGVIGSVLPPAPSVLPADGNDTLGLNKEMQQLHGEIAQLVQRIKQTKLEMSSLTRGKLSSKRIHVVKDELDSVIADTENATATILGSVERIDAAARYLKANSKNVTNQEWADEVMDQTVKVFEACNFQDLTGQRITKVVNTLKFIEERVAAIIGIIGEDVFADFQGSLDQADHPDGLENTLSVPTKEAERVTQEDIDKMFS